MRNGCSRGDRWDTFATWQLDVRGGTLLVTERHDGHVELTGPAVLVAEGELSEPWLAAEKE